MKERTLLILTIVLLYTCQPCSTQPSVEVSISELSFMDSRVQILYDILNSAETDEFAIRVEVTNSQGRLFDARSLSGDIGENVLGGFNKKIIWDIVADSIFLDEEIFVEVYALAKPTTVADAPATDDSFTEVTTLKNPPLEEAEESNAKSDKTFNRTAVIVQSVVLPGLGLSRVNPGQPHWIKGVVGYGCLAGALYFNNKAVVSYDAYKNTTALEDVDGLFNKAEKQDVTSEVLAFAALGVWVSDLVWNILGTSDLNKGSSSLSHKGLSFGATFEQVSSVPLLALRYEF